MLRWLRAAAEGTRDRWEANRCLVAVHPRMKGECRRGVSLTTGLFASRFHVVGARAREIRPVRRQREPGGCLQQAQLNPVPHVRSY